jgi:hypothetical protein
MVIVVDVGKVVMLHLRLYTTVTYILADLLRQKAPRINNTERM